MTFPALVLGVAFHSSLTHEVVHGHPTKWQGVNVAMVALPLSLVVPYGRFRDLHLAHHKDTNLTDPYDDPESNYWDPAEWDRLPAWFQVLLKANNRLLGRMILGPAIGQWAFLRWDIEKHRAGDRAVLRAWLLHLPLAACVLLAVVAAPVSFWTYLLALYLGLGLLKIRTFLEHQAHQVSRARSVIIEDRGPLALLFLNNNLHAVHHMHPDVAWYRLPSLYRRGRDRYLSMNEGYRFASYLDVFRLYLFKAKDPVPHPIGSDRRLVD